MSITRLDALSDVLLHAHLRGEEAALFAPDVPFHVAIPAGPPRVHFALGTRLLVHVGGRDGVIELEPADFVLIGPGVPHSIATTAATGAARPLRPEDRNTDSPADPGWVTGVFRSEDEVAAPLLAALPSVVHASAAKPGNEWQRLSLQLLLDEVGPGRPGAWIMISRILDLMFIHALREWAASEPVTTGWLATALDDRLAPAISAIHQHPEYPWTVDELAALTRQSRSTFAHRFTALVGQSPMAYLAERRFMTAVRLLESTTMSVGGVADAVGYVSLPAFSRAFRRQFGVPPLAWRQRAREHRAAAAAAAGGD